MKVAILGGSFNPPHKGHLLVAREVLRALDCDEVWLLPCFDHPEEKPIAPAKHRLAMVRLALKDSKLKRVKASDLEIRFLKRKNYSADTVKFLQKRFPKHEFYWIYGSELVEKFPMWAKWKQLRELLPLVIYPRPGFKLPNKKFISGLGAELIFLPSNMRKSPVSSTLVRSLLAKKSRRAARMIPASVFRYIEKNGLYGWKA